jgi:hypothetical protein
MKIVFKKVFISRQFRHRSEVTTGTAQISSPPAEKPASSMLMAIPIYSLNPMTVSYGGHKPEPFNP